MDAKTVIAILVVLGAVALGFFMMPDPGPLAEIAERVMPDKGHGRVVYSKFQMWNSKGWRYYLIAVDPPCSLRVRRCFYDETEPGDRVQGLWRKGVRGECRCSG